MQSPGRATNCPGHGDTLTIEPFLEPSVPLSRLVVPKLVRQSPVHDWFVFPHSFAPALVADVVRTLKVPLDSVVADCFVGSGTTAVAAQTLGFRPFATDLMPIACLATRVKTTAFDVRQLRALAASFRSRADPGAHVDRFNSVTAAFSGEQLDELDGIVGWAGTLEPVVADFFRLALGAAIEPHSRLKKAGGWLKAVDCPAEVGPITPTFLARVEAMASALDGRPAPRHGARVELADARALPWEDASVALALTSPPYLNKHDYTRVFCLELAVACGMSWADIKKLRHGTLRSHVEAHEPPDETQAPFAFADEWIAAAGDHLDDRLPRLIRGYFRDMGEVLKQLHRVVVPGGHIVLVVGDVRFAGSVLPVADFLSRVAEELGLERVGMQVARHRGNSAQQMKEHGRVGVPEWILAWRR